MSALRLRVFHEEDTPSPVPAHDGADASETPRVHDQDGPLSYDRIPQLAEDNASARARHLLTIISRLCWRVNARSIHATTDDLAAESRTSSATVNRALAELKRDGWIHWEPVRGCREITLNYDLAGRRNTGAHLISSDKPGLSVLIRRFISSDKVPPLRENLEDERKNRLVSFVPASAPACEPDPAAGDADETTTTRDDTSFAAPGIPEIDEPPAPPAVPATPIVPVQAVLDERPAAPAPAPPPSAAPGVEPRPDGSKGAKSHRPERLAGAEERIRAWLAKAETMPDLPPEPETRPEPEQPRVPQSQGLPRKHAAHRPRAAPEPPPPEAAPVDPELERLIQGVWALQGRLDDQVAVWKAAVALAEHWNDATQFTIAKWAGYFAELPAARIEALIRLTARTAKGPPANYFSFLAAKEIKKPPAPPRRPEP